MGLEKLVALRQPEALYFDERGGAHEAEGVVDIQYWTGSKMIYRVQTEDAVDVLQHTAYFPGWRVWVNGEETIIDYADSEFPGRIIFNLPKGKHKIEAKFTNDTWPLKIGDGVSLLAVVIVAGIFIWQVHHYVIGKKQTG